MRTPPDAAPRGTPPHPTDTDGLADSTRDALCASPTSASTAPEADRPRRYLCEGDATLTTPQGRAALLRLVEYRRENPGTPPDALVIPVYADTLDVAGAPECVVVPEPPATVVQLPSAQAPAPPAPTDGNAPTALARTPAHRTAHPASHAPMGAPAVLRDTRGLAFGTLTDAATETALARTRFWARTLGRTIPIVAFAGPRGSGKDAAAFAVTHGNPDTAAQYGIDGAGWFRVALADELKRRVAFTFGTPWESLIGPSARREAPHAVHADWRARWDAVFGPALFTYPWEAPRLPAMRAALDERIAVARERVQGRITAHLAEHGAISARLLCQWIGTDFARAVDDAVWVNHMWWTYAELCRGSAYTTTDGVHSVGPCYVPPEFNGACDDLATLPRRYLPATHDGRSCGSAQRVAAGVLVPDVRFANEVTALTLAGPPWLRDSGGGRVAAWQHGAVWWLDAEGAPWCPPRMDHASEPTYADLAHVVTGVIPNRPEPTAGEGAPDAEHATRASLRALSQRVCAAVGAFVAARRRTP